jgi:hypothetical protein
MVKTLEAFDSRHAAVEYTSVAYGTDGRFAELR